MTRWQEAEINRNLGPGLFRTFKRVTRLLQSLATRLFLSLRQEAKDCRLSHPLMSLVTHWHEAEPLQTLGPHLFQSSER